MTISWDDWTLHAVSFNGLGSHEGILAICRLKILVQRDTGSTIFIPLAKKEASFLPLAHEQEAD